MGKIEFFKHNLEADDIERVAEVLRSIFLTTGSVVARFESEFSEYTGLPHSVAVTSCTAGLHLSLLALGIGEGDEVITTPLSFCATSNAVMHAGARPVFIDVERDTGNMDASLLERAVSERTKAVLPVHLYGQMCDMRSIRESADTHGLSVIEDAAHAIEAERDGVRVGHLSDSACYSFYATKNITSGEGGAVCSRRQDLADVVRMLRLHGIDKSAIDRYTRRYQHWDMPLLGWKYNMDNIHASLLLGQLERIEELRSRRERLWRLYEEELSGVDGVELLKTRPGAKHARHLLTVLVDARRRDAILWTLQEKGIGVAVNYRPIHLLSFYRATFGYREGDFPVAEEIGARTISLPLYPKLQDEEVLRVVGAVREAVASA